MRNGPCRWKASAIIGSVARHKAAWKVVLAAPAREDPREGVMTGPSKTGVREATRTSEVGRIGPLGENIPDSIASLEEG